MEIVLTQKGLFGLWGSGALETTLAVLNCFNALLFIEANACKHDKAKTFLCGLIMG